MREHRQRLSTQSIGICRSLVNSLAARFAARARRVCALDRGTMKLPRFALVCVLVGWFAGVLSASSFEGMLKWSFRAELTDPAMKAQMDDASKQLADPQQLAEMKAMLADPQMQAMMAANPQMKAALEGQVRAAESAAAGGGPDMFSALLPTGMTLRTKGGRTHLLVEGGAMAMEVIGGGEPPQSILLDRTARTFSRIPLNPDLSETEKLATRVTKTDVSSKILGYTCTQYRFESAQDGKPINGLVWATEEIPGLSGDVLGQVRISKQNDDVMAQIAGVPLKIELNTAEMNLRVEATAIRSAPVNEAIFAIPAGFTEKTLGSVAVPTVR